MQLGFAIPISGSWATPENVVILSEKAEALGYASLWTFQRLLSPLDGDTPRLAPQYRSVDDPLTLLAFAAAKTTSVRLGTAIVNVPYYSPVVLAKALTTIDRLSAGRLDAGLGIGWSPDEFAAAGMSYDHRGARADDFIRCLVSIWTEPVVEYDGPYYRIPRSRIDPKPVQAPHPPILLGGTAPAALRRAGRISAGWISSSQADLARIDEPIAIVRDAALAAGRDPAALRFVCRGVVKVRSDERGPLTGSLDDIRDDLGMLAEKGVTETFLDLNFDPEIGNPEADPVRSIERAHEVVEAFAPG
ncbi:MAG TPA: TIGR03619 family F420-dependent LLM class oxidoreductase [Acidimicrobiales bacterium]|nr:TIGR03619 family F420-dependent LLM class oxidoreductase [Acidimicrobiales bacterium]